MTLRVAHVLNSPGRGGVPQVAHALIRAADRTRIAPHLFHLKAGATDTSLDCPCASASDQGGKTGAMTDLLGWLSDNRIDILHCHSFRPNLYARLAGAVLRPRLKIVAHYHNIYDDKWRDPQTLALERQLRFALYASVIGNIFSCVVLMALAEPLARFALDFGPAEIAMLMLFALLVIVLFGGGSKLDALIMVLVGACAGIVGLDPISGTPRFTFGSFALENGFQLIPVLIGLFAMSEVLLQAFDREPLVGDVGVPPLKSSVVR